MTPTRNRLGYREGLQDRSWENGVRWVGRMEDDRWVKWKWGAQGKYGVPRRERTRDHETGEEDRHRSGSCWQGSMREGRTGEGMEYRWLDWGPCWCTWGYESRWQSMLPWTASAFRSTRASCE